MKQKSVLILLVIIVSLVSFVPLYYLAKHPRYFIKIKAIFKEIIKGDRDFEYTTKVKNDAYALHLKSAKANGILLKDSEQIQRELANGNLVEVSNGSGYVINKLNYSEPVLLKSSYEILKEIGKTFQEQNKGNYFTVTSLTRSVKSQKKLSKTNLNATKNTSTHSYGASFDISYIRFNGIKQNNKTLKQNLEKILIDLQKEKKIYLIYERKTSCYHVTVR